LSRGGKAASQAPVAAETRRAELIVAERRSV
jgi:hypothetical protein